MSACCRPSIATSLGYSTDTGVQKLALYPILSLPPSLSSENSEEINLHSCPSGSSLQPTTGSRHSDSVFIETADGRWQCLLCNKLYAKTSLRAHTRVHTGERPYQCQYCYRTFCHAATKRNHERLHTGEKPHKCDRCGRAFTQLAGLRSHLKTHRYDA